MRNNENINTEIQGFFPAADDTRNVEQREEEEEDKKEQQSDMFLGAPEMEAPWSEEGWGGS